MKKTILNFMAIVGTCLVSLNAHALLQDTEAGAPNWKLVYPLEDLKNQIFEVASEVPANKVNLNLYEAQKYSLQKQGGLQFDFSSLSLAPSLVDTISQVKFSQEDTNNSDIVYESFIYEEMYGHSVYRNDPLRDSKGNANKWVLSVTGGLAKNCSQSPSVCKIIRVHINEVKVENFIVVPVGGTSSAGGSKIRSQLQNLRPNSDSFRSYTKIDSDYYKTIPKTKINKQNIFNLNTK